jgi:lipid-A-disaccharide synthase-like uncharacterized protein
MGASTLFSPRVWLVIGFTGQALFTARFVVQWLVSERKRDSVMPVAFWWLSLLGGLTLLSYVSYRQDPVMMLGQAMGLVVYVRNLMLVDKSRRRAARRRHRAEARAGEPGQGVPSKPHRIDRGAERVTGADRP